VAIDEASVVVPRSAAYPTSSGHRAVRKASTGPKRSVCRIAIAAITAAGHTMSRIQRTICGSVRTVNRTSRNRATSLQTGRTAARSEPWTS
jgi:hypothetical protein